ncbi:nucleotide sugar dehydrogenase [Paracoccus gahaiensis]|uniref:Nucleotide sugar dehydrogenase n=1 Tax=Paracoccus gahaiensis TaxID=1706839 RepID=A0A4V5MVQ7_9RHOB|nr:nucleotide sugar dehydrogenase [Paracoccus gahaiensis]
MQASGQLRRIQVSAFIPPKELKIAVIGLGYVGLPLAVALGQAFDTVGFDLNVGRVASLRDGNDVTGEVDARELARVSSLRFTAAEDDLEGCNVFIVAVPTPIDTSLRPDLGPLISASRVVGRAIRTGGVVIYESTVYPGATEEDCIPIVEEVSELRFNTDFFAGYSPERINPGDKARPLTKIVKVTSGSTPEVADFVDAIYNRIIEAGTFKASSIRVAEASKIIENTQRDVNIALINELSIVFSHLGIDTHEVLDAAATKWNFIKLSPGLVGGHCIGVDPYYLVHKATAAGFIPDIIRSAREINDGMARNAVHRLIKAMVARDLPIKGAKVLVAGFTFKENCPDTRNTKVIDLLNHMRGWGIEAIVADTWANPAQVHEEYGLHIETALPETGEYDAIVLTVAHEEVVRSGAERLRRLLKPRGVLFDMKSAFGITESDLRL